MSRRLHCLALLLSFVVGCASAEIRFRSFEDPDEPQWQEAEPPPPAFPQGENLLKFYVSAGTTNQFYVDGNSINPGADGVVRFVLVVKAAGGAMNVSYEGVRCSTLEAKIYATGSNGAWTRSRNAAWRPIENKDINRQHAVLSRDFFCPNMLPIKSAEEGRFALRRGKHPDSQ